MRYAKMCWLVVMTEADLQEAIITWAHTLEPRYIELKWLHAVPNGGLRSGREAMSLKRQGVKSGVLDLHLPVTRGGYGGLMIELKTPTGKCKAPSKEQAEYMQFLRFNGYCARISNDFDEVKTLIVDYLEGRVIHGAHA